MLKISATQSAKNLLLSSHLAKDTEVGGGSDFNEIVKRLLSKNLNKPLSSLTFNAR